MHRAQHLHVASGVEPKPTGQAAGHDVHDQLGDPLGILLSEQEEVGQAMGDGRPTGVDAVALVTTPLC
jgi:hypothetical protein